MTALRKLSVFSFKSVISVITPTILTGLPSSIIGVTEILHLTKTAVSRDKNTFFFVIAAVIYLVMNTVLTYAFKKVEAKINYEKEG